jgi:hypothetical protein
VSVLEGVRALDCLTCKVQDHLQGQRTNGVYSPTTHTPFELPKQCRR